MVKKIVFILHLDYSAKDYEIKYKYLIDSLINKYHIVKDVTKLLLELGTGFAFLGNQYHLNVGGDDFYIDLLFYNLNLRYYVVIELKTGSLSQDTLVN